MARAIEGKVATIDDEVRLCRVDERADALEICDELRKARAKMRIGDLDQAEFGHGWNSSGGECSHLGCQSDGSGDRKVRSRDI
ncbi:hypothetical protein SAMN05216367_5575 [Tardiphaga sp. OK245]|nr:hypothetical protein SAMN05216367_5575 [Tardiphaga sp. OK245]